MTDTIYEPRGWNWIVHLEFESGHTDWISVGARTPAEAKKQALQAFEGRGMQPVAFRSHPTVGDADRDVDEVQTSFGGDQLFDLAKTIVEEVTSA